MTLSFWGGAGGVCHIMTDDDIGGKPNDDTLHRKLILNVVTDANDDVWGVGGKPNYDS